MNAEGVSDNTRPNTPAHRNDKCHVRWGGGRAARSGLPGPPPRRLTRHPGRPSGGGEGGGAGRASASRLPADPESSGAGTGWRSRSGRRGARARARWGPGERDPWTRGSTEGRVYPIAAGAGGAGPGVSVERARPPWARMVRTMAGSCTVARTRRRPPQRGQARTSRSNRRIYFFIATPSYSTKMGAISVSRSRPMRTPRHNRRCCWRRSYCTRGGALARVHRADSFDPPQLNAIRSMRAIVRRREEENTT